MIWSVFASATHDSEKQSVGAQKHSRRYAAKQQSKRKHELLWAERGRGITRNWAPTALNSVFSAASPTVMPLSRYVRALHTAAACLSLFGQITAPFCKGANALGMTGTIPWTSSCSTPSFLLSFMHLRESLGQA